MTVAEWREYTGATPAVTPDPAPAPTPAALTAQPRPWDPEPGPEADLDAHDQWLLRQWARRHPNMPAELAAHTATIAQWLTQLEPQGRTVSQSREPRTIKDRLRTKLARLIEQQRTAQPSR